MSRTKRLAVYLRDVCLDNKFPVWATLLGVVAGGALTMIGTYFIVPKINESLEQQKIKTAFVIKNLDDMNERTRMLMSEISDLHSRVLATDQVDAPTLQKLVSRIAEMQWKAVELGVIFEGTKGSLVVSRYQVSLDNLRVAITSIKTKGDLALSQRSAEVFAQRSLDMIRELAFIGGIRIGPSATPKS